MAYEQSSGSEKYVTNPYFLHYFDHPRMVLVSKPLNGDNYSTCCRAMTPSLNIKSKRGFVDGTIKIPYAKNEPDDYALWTRCNDMILSWILNSLTLDLADIVIFYHIIRNWQDIQDYFSRNNAPRIFQITRDIACLTQDWSHDCCSLLYKIERIMGWARSYNDIVCSCRVGHKRHRLMPFFYGTQWVL